MPELVFEIQTLGETRVCYCYLSDNGHGRRLIASMCLPAGYNPKNGIEPDGYMKNEILRWSEAKHYN